ncbi:Hypothetical protein RG540_CH25370 [Neorhizobium galegae bv. orientalis str. HAMBI 540]|uniref:Lipoprotein n=3 Tax=Neorhizobium galegae TaxID=399 RepID=A0A068SR53_NEOGA|nr:Hypothetical protein RG540_CH25370 [Neorhizobium galegae bv. orientalis str. HAMBI 540]
MRNFRTLLCYPMTIAALALMASSVHGQEAEHYTAVSKTAMSVTGDVWLDDFSITFENEESLEFSDLVADNFRVDGRRVPASVYRVAKPADPELENGNQLCGSGDVTYVANWASGKGMSAIAVFTGRNPPKSNAELCALYTYEDPQ